MVGGEGKISSAPMKFGSPGKLLWGVFSLAHSPRATRSATVCSSCHGSSSGSFVVVGRVSKSTDGTRLACMLYTIADLLRQPFEGVQTMTAAQTTKIASTVMVAASQRSRMTISSEWHQTASPVVEVEAFAKSNTNCKPRQLSRWL